MHEDFRVIALGLPVPPFPGKPLDPPLRSRFQARVIPAADADALFESVCQVAPSVPVSTLQTLVTFVESVKTLENSLMSSASSSATACPFPNYSAVSMAKSLEMAVGSFGQSVDPDAALGSLISRAYPFFSPTVRSTFPLPHQNALDTLLEKLGINTNISAANLSSNARVTGVQAVEPKQDVTGWPYSASVSVSIDGGASESTPLLAPAGSSMSLSSTC